MSELFFNDSLRTQRWVTKKAMQFGLIGSNAFVSNCRFELLTGPFGSSKAKENQQEKGYTQNGS